MLSQLKKLLTRVERDGEGGDVDVEKAALVEMVKTRFKEAQQKRQMIELQMLLNTAFLDGNQHMCINGYTMTMEETPRTLDYEVREVYNQIAPIYDTRLAKLGRVKPILRVRPMTSDMEDINTSRVCTAIVRGTYADLDMSELIDEANAWSELCGTAFYKQSWNREGGRVIGQYDGARIYEGKVGTSVISPFEIFPESLYKEKVSQQRYIIHARAMHVSEIEEVYGVKLRGRDVNVYSLSSTEIGVGGLGYNSQQMRMRTSKEKDHEIVIEYWENPSKKFPCGRIVIIAGDTFLGGQAELPYKCGSDSERAIPIVKQVSIKVAGRFFGKSVIERLIPVQTQYNTLLNRRSEFLNRAAIGIPVIEENSIANFEDIEEYGLEPGTPLILRKGADKPSFLQNNSMPLEFESDINRCISDFIRISGVSEISRDSSVPTGTGSGVALNILKEQDDTRMSLPADYIRKAVMQVGAQWLRLAKQFASGPRVLRYVGEDNVVWVMNWQASDITSDDIEIENENELTRTPAQREQSVMDMLQYKLFVDPDTGEIDPRMRTKILQMLNMATLDDAFDIEELHIKDAQRENALLERGKLPEIEMFDNHNLHYDEHVKYRLSSEYARLQEKNPDMAIAFDAHIMQHQQKEYARQIQATANEPEAV